MLKSKLFGMATLGAALLVSGTAHGQAKCQAALEKQANKWSATVMKSLQKCVDGAQKARDAGGINAKAALGCEGAIAKLNAARAKTGTKCLGTKCTAAELGALGHLISTYTAPVGTGDPVAGIAPGAIDFTCAWVLRVAEHRAYQSILAAAPAAQALMVNTGDVDICVGGPTPGASCNVNADCGMGGTCPELTPALTAYLKEPRCNTHVCRMTGSSSATLQVNVGGSPVDAFNLSVTGAVPLEVCTLPAGSGLPLHPDTKLVATAPNKGLTPVTVLPGITACVGNVRTQGWCDCGAASVFPLPTGGKNYTVCRDSDTANAGDNCSTVPGLAPGGAPDNNGGPAWAGFSGGSATGDCGGTISVSFSIVTPGLVGADSTACTFDDTAEPLASNGLPFTTGTANALVFDAQNPGENTGNPYADLATTGGGVTGAGIACANYESSNLSGMKLVGSAPLLTSGGASDITGDNIISLELSCL